MALSLSTPDGIVSVDRTDDGLVVTVAGSVAKLTVEHAALLADYLAAKDEVVITPVDQAPPIDASS